MKVVWLGNTNAKSTLSFSYNSGDRFKKKKINIVEFVTK